MKFYFKTSIFFVLSMLLAPNEVYKNIFPSETVAVKENKEMRQAERNYISKYQFEKGYEEAIGFIKSHEGFAGGKAYYDAAGIKTIGYGHRIKKGEIFPEKITRKEAENILRKDFDKAVWYAERETSVKGYKKIVVAHFIYAKGIGNFRRSTFKKKVDAKEPVDEELKKWCYYRGENGEPVRSEYIYKIRLWEIEMYNRES
ncbi:MAG: lysozyme [Bacteroidales bacterium]|nr:lysozyme [Bacteroidales bacterium]